MVNYDPIDKTVLANEQVKNGYAERSGAKVELIELEQWYFNITKYADRLIDDLDKVDYPESTKKQQIAWIGKSNGYEIDFGDDIKIFTTNPETILDVKFIVIPSENGKEEFTGEYILNPISHNEIPIYTSLYVIKGYGTGYVMGVPNDDKRDRDFANRHNISFDEEKNIISLDDLQGIIIPKTNYKLRDWCVSRQRKFGCPIPIDGETDTLDTFVDSSFYTIEYNKEKPVDIYVGGNEHACMHLIYSRFICKFLYDIGYINFDEPFKKVVHQGMILGSDGEKMSKTKGNVINPVEYEPQLLKMNLMFINHYFDGGKWQDTAYKGVEKFRNRLFIWLNNSNDNDNNLYPKIDDFKTKIIDYYNSWKVNKVVSEWMIFYNNNKTKTLSKKQAVHLKEFFDICF